MEDARKRDAMIAENREEWERLLFLLRQQQPKVFWINGDTDCVWLEMLPALKEALPGHTHHEVRVNGDTPSLYRAIEEAVGPPGAHNVIHVLGMSAAVESRLFLKNLNLERELLFRRAPGHVIIWGSQSAVNIIASRAHDWWSWIAFTFPFHTPTALLNARQRDFSTEMQIGDRVLSVESKDAGERIRHLKQEWEDFCESISSAPMTARMAGELADLALALGSEYREAGKYRSAAAVLRMAAARCEGLLPGMKWSDLLNNLGLNLLSLSEYKEAEDLLSQSLAFVEHNLGSSHSKVAIRLNNLATLLQATNRLSEAEPLKRRALEIDEQSFGKDHPEVAVDLNNLAQLLQDTNRLSEAEPLMRRALEIDEQSLGKDHPEVATRLNNLAWLLQITNRLSEAEPLMRRALSLLLCSLGGEHPNTNIVLKNYRLLLQAQGKSEADIETALATLPDESL